MSVMTMVITFTSGILVKCPKGVLRRSSVKRPVHSRSREPRSRTPSARAAAPSGARQRPRNSRMAEGELFAQSESSRLSFQEGLHSLDGASGANLPAQVTEGVQETEDTDSESESEHWSVPKVPLILKPNLPLSNGPDTLSRDSSKNSRQATRNSSKNSVELQKTVDGLSAFRTALEANQKHSLRLLDAELDKLRRRTNLAFASQTSYTAPERPSMTFREKLMLPGALGRNPSEKEDWSAVEGAALAVIQGNIPGAGGRVLHASVAPPPVQRKRRMSWIHKQSTTYMDKVDTLKPEPGGVRKIMSKDEKDKAKKDAAEFHQSGMLSQLNSELAKDNIITKAAEELEMGKESVLKTEGWLVRLASHPSFERITLAVILLNAVWIGVDIEFNHADMLFQAAPIFIIMENFFCGFFSFELIVRFGIYRKTWYAIKDVWFMADFCLVALMIMETWIMPLIQALTGAGGGISNGASVLRVARVMRVLRTARMARLVRLMPELMILIKGMMVAFRSVFFTLILLLLFTYVFSVAFVQFSRDTVLARDFFGSMGSAVSTLILKCILTDQESLILAVTQESWMMGVLLLVFILFGSLTVMNMLLGVLVEAIKTVSTIEREQLEVDFAKKVLWDMINKGEADTDGDNLISEEEYMAVLQKPQAMTALTSLGVDVEAALDYGKLLFEDGEKLTFGDFMRGILTLRGSNQTTVKDIVDLRKFTGDEFSQLHEVLSNINQCLAQVPGPAHLPLGAPLAVPLSRCSFASSRTSQPTSARSAGGNR
ncbi:unnamed protein product [Effrenium voratum]|uniref:Ion transport domain-containing protein n=1 Tax=Effrenium voratum TaxID=2562239 RepID=A0AA36IJ39_9DINO|nr:unnamed protein product [Effrenium voratum]